MGNVNRAQVAQEKQANQMLLFLLSIYLLAQWQGLYALPCDGKLPLIPGTSKMLTGTNILQLKDTVPLFNLSSDPGEPTADGKWCTYTALKWEGLHECAFLSSMVRSDSYVDFAESMKLFCDVDSFLDLFGSATSEFQFAAQMFASQNWSATFNYAYCKHFQLGFSPDTIPQLRLGVLRAMQELPVELDLLAYFQFLRDFGPWVRVDGHFGGDLKRLVFTSQDYVRLHTSTDLRTQADAGFMYSLTLDTRYSQKLTMEYNTSSVSRSLIVNGGAWTPGKTNWDEYGQMTEQQPMPVWQGLKPISWVFDAKYAADVVNLEIKRTNMDEAIALFVTPQCHWNTTYQLQDNRKASMTIVRAATRPEIGHAKPAFSYTTPLETLSKNKNLSVSGLVDSFTTPRFGYSGFAYLSPNLFKFSCARNSNGMVSAQISQGDGMGPWRNWGDCCSLGLNVGEYTEGNCALFQNQPDKCFKTVTGTPDPCQSVARLAVAPWVLQGYHAWKDEDSYRDSSITVTFTCDLL